jgi:hypothetical protein
MEEYVEEYEEELEDVTLSSALAVQFGQAPWYVSSVAVHCVIFLLLLLIAPPVKQDEMRRIVITTEMVEEEVFEEEDKPEPEVVENKIEVEAEVEVDTPVITTQDVEISDTFETADEMDNDNALGDPDNMSDLDSEFVGTPALMGIGATGGKGGGGRFGFRDGGGRRNKVRIGGGSKKTESSVDMALRWLAAHQESDGRWDCKKYGGGHHGGDDVAVTSMALLAFLGAGNSSRFGRYRRNVRSGVEWLIQQQGANGCIGQHRYTGGLSTMAIAEAYGMSQSSELRDAAQKAVDWAVKSQNTNGSWDYGPNSARSDLSVAGWWIMGLKSAKVAGLGVPTEVMDKALSFVDSWTTDTGKAGYTQAGSGSIRMTAVSLTCQQFLGHERNHPKVIACAEATIKNLPNGQTPDFYLTYYQALGLFQTGIKSDYWKAFNDPMKVSLLSTQVTEGTYEQNKGSWNHDGDKYGGSWGRVGQTALGALMLEVYYRYAEVSKKK